MKATITLFVVVAMGAAFSACTLIGMGIGASIDTGARVGARSDSGRTLAPAPLPPPPMPFGDAVSRGRIEPGEMLLFHFADGSVLDAWYDGVEGQRVKLRTAAEQHRFDVEVTAIRGVQRRSALNTSRSGRAPARRHISGALTGAVIGAVIDITIVVVFFATFEMDMNIGLRAQ